MAQSTRTINARIVESLEKLPAELVYQVLSDLPLYHTLKLACHGNEWINSCILNHGKYTLLFSNFGAIKDSFRLYEEICSVLQLNRLGKKRDSILAVNSTITTQPPAVAQRVFGPLSMAVNNYMYARMWVALQCVERRLPLLNAIIDADDDPLPTVWDYSRLPNLEKRWRGILAAEAKLNRLKSAQLLRLADLVEANAEWLIISTDQRAEQEGRRIAAAHVSQQFRHAAKLLLVSGQVFRKPNTGGTRLMYLFRVDGLPVRPTQQSLELLLRGLEKYPHRVRQNASENQNQIQNRGERDDQDGTIYHPYPANIDQDIRTTLKGLGYIYTNPAEPRSEIFSPPFRRTENTPYSPRSATASSADKGRHTTMGSANVEGAKSDDTQPRFCARALRFAPTRFGNVDMKGSMPHDKREIAWLEAYLRVVQYMRDVLGVQ